MKSLKKYPLFLGMAAFLLSGTAYGLDAKGDGMGGTGKNMTTNESMKKQAAQETMTKESAPMKDEGLKAGETEHDKGSTMKNESMKKQDDMMKTGDSMQ
jgi:hypothetical protein